MSFSTKMAFSTKIKGNHYLQGNVQVYTVRIPTESLRLGASHLLLSTSLPKVYGPSIITGFQ